LRPTPCCDCRYAVGGHGVGFGLAGWLGFGWAFGLAGWSGFGGAAAPTASLALGGRLATDEVPSERVGPVPDLRDPAWSVGARFHIGPAVVTVRRPDRGWADRVGDSAISLEPATAPECSSTGVGDAKVTGRPTRPPYSFFFGTGPARPAPATWCQVLEIPAGQALPGEPTCNRIRTAVRTGTVGGIGGWWWRGR
jgi:hypothetical protein